MMERPSFAAYVELEAPDAGIVYAGEAIYRPGKAHPVTGVPAPMVGIPDDSMSTRPSGVNSYAVWLSGERIPTAGVYLERVTSCWWFVLETAPVHPPTI